MRSGTLLQSLLASAVASLLLAAVLLAAPVASVLLASVLRADVQSRGSGSDDRLRLLLMRFGVQQRPPQDAT